MTNIEIAQLISEQIGQSPIPHNDIRNISYEIYQELGGESELEDFDDIYELLLTILPMAREGGVGVIDDTSIRTDKTWSSSKINSEIEAHSGVTYTAGQNISIDASNAISADGYVFDETNGSFVTKYLNTDEDESYIATNTASGEGAFAEGYGTTATGMGNHAEGGATQATGSQCAHAEGLMTVASGKQSHAEGLQSTAQNETEHAEGKSNVSHKANTTYGNAGNTQHSVGINQKNAIEIMQNGDYYLYGVGGYQGTDTKVQNASILTLQDVVNGKADAYEVATLADILALFAEPVPPTQPNDEIWYTTTNNEAITIDPESAEYYFDKPILSNTYSDGKGIIKFDGDLTSIEDVFYNITENYDALTSVSIPESVTNLAYGSYLFSGCSNLTTVKLPTTYEGGIGESFFSGCENLETLIIPEGTTYIGDGAFGGCISLTTITIPSNVTNLGPSAFSNCESLMSVTCEPTTPPYATGYMFEGTNDCPIYVPAESVNAYKTAEGWSLYANRIEVIQ